jgi:hypothetical protein
MNISREVIKVGSFGIEESRISDVSEYYPTSTYIPKTIREPLMAEYAELLRGDESDLSCSDCSSFSPAVPGSVRQKITEMFPRGKDADDNFNKDFEFDSAGRLTRHRGSCHSSHRELLASAFGDTHRDNEDHKHRHNAQISCDEY